VIYEKGNEKKKAGGDLNTANLSNGTKYRILFMMFFKF
jgi:hypothetical protein